MRSGRLISFGEKILTQRGRKARADEQNDAGDNERDEGRAQPDSKVGVVGDTADDLRREGIAEEVDAEEIHGYGGGSDGCGDGVDDCRIEWAGVEEEEELGSEKGRNGETRGTKKKQHSERQGESDAPEAEQVESPMVGTEPALRYPASNGGAEDAVDNGSCASKLACFGDGHTDRVVEELGNPVRDSAHGKGEHGEAEGGAKECWIAKEAEDRRTVRRGTDVILAAALRLATEDSI